MLGDFQTTFAFQAWAPKPILSLLWEWPSPKGADKHHTRNDLTERNSPLKRPIGRCRRINLVVCRAEPTNRIFTPCPYNYEQEKPAIHYTALKRP